MTYDMTHDQRRLYPGIDQRNCWSPTDWYREAIDVLTKYAASGDRVMSGGVALHTRDYLKLTGCAKQIVAVQDAQNERNRVALQRDDDIEPVS